MGTVEAALELHAEGGEPAGGKDYERVVALKRLLPDAARDPRRVEMFMREATLAKMLDHPNVVRAYDYGEVDGELFLAMEYVEVRRSRACPRRSPRRRAISVRHSPRTCSR
ncbi:protein kinase, partial [Escherichia coli]|uniref:protein kinase n=1 Tax=Escherichia coli TaxID=562 RepID=UPI00208DC939